MESAVPAGPDSERAFRPDFLDAARDEARRCLDVLCLPSRRGPSVGWNAALRTAAGRYLPRANRIELNPAYAARFGLNEVVATVRHEMCHLGRRAGSSVGHADPLFLERRDTLRAPGRCLSIPGSVRRSRSRFEYVCPTCRRRVVYRRRVRGLACRPCCDRYAGGAWREAFRLRLVRSRTRDRPPARPSRGGRQFELPFAGA